MSRRTPTLLDLLSSDLGVCKVSMQPNPVGRLMVWRAAGLHHDEARYVTAALLTLLWLALAGRYHWRHR
jgi:hypothetical protein